MAVLGASHLLPPPPTQHPFVLSEHLGGFITVGASLPVEGTQCRWQSCLN